MEWTQRLAYARFTLDFQVLLLSICQLGEKSRPVVESGDDVKQDHAEGNDARDDAKPRQDELAFILARRRRGHSKDQVKSPEYFCEEFDHGLPRNGKPELQ